MRAPRAFVKAVSNLYTRRVLPTPCYIISDAHLGIADRASELRLVEFLNWARSDAGSLVVNGDLFDFWFEWKRVIPRAGFRTLGAVAAFGDRGIPALWVAGNHDCWGGEVIRDDLGVQYELGPWKGRIGRWRVRIEHGDGLRPVEDRRYRVLKAIVRNRAAMWMYRNLLHPDWAAGIASGSSAASRNYAAVDKGEGLKRIAAGELERAVDLDLVVFGHSHAAALVESRHGVYANAGNWLTDSTFLRVTENSVELFRWQGSGAAPGELLSRAAHAG
ncbi:MAG: UDP-2,3-diacylglucosamine diphosphatase [Gemmatimonadota bacterium]